MGRTRRPYIRAVHAGYLARKFEYYAGLSHWLSLETMETLEFTFYGRTVQSPTPPRRPRYKVADASAADVLCSDHKSVRAAFSVVFCLSDRLPRYCSVTYSSQHLLFTYCFVRSSWLASKQWCCALSNTNTPLSYNSFIHFYLT